MYIQLLIYTIYVHTVQKNAFYLFASARRRKGCVMCIIQVQLKIRPINLRLNKKLFSNEPP